MVVLVSLALEISQKEEDFATTLGALDSVEISEVNIWYLNVA